MSIFDENHIERTSVVGPYTEGADLILSCEVNGGKLIVFTFIFTRIYLYTMVQNYVLSIRYS